MLTPVKPWGRGHQWCTPPFSTKIGGGVAKNPAAAAFGGVASFFHRKLFIENNIDVYMYHSWIPHWHTALSTCNYKLTMKPGVWCPAWYKSNSQAFKIWKFWWNISYICARRYFCAQFLNSRQIFIIFKKTVHAESRRAFFSASAAWQKNRRRRRSAAACITGGHCNGPPPH